MIIVFDIDGTLADIGPRYEKAGDAPKKTNKKAFQQWLNKLQKRGDLLQDKPIKCMKELAWSLMRSYQIIYLTGRDEKYRDVSIQWLFNVGFPPGELLMRPHDDIRETNLYKEEQMIEVVKKYEDNRILIFDDDPEENCNEVYKKHGWTWLRSMENVE